jgi:hypothetical protein
MRRCDPFGPGRTLGRPNKKAKSTFKDLTSQTWPQTKIDYRRTTKFRLTFQHWNQTVRCSGAARPCPLNVVQRAKVFGANSRDREIKTEAWALAHESPAHEHLVRHEARQREWNKFCIVWMVYLQKRGMTAYEANGPWGQPPLAAQAPFTMVFDAIYDPVLCCSARRTYEQFRGEQRCGQLSLR